MKFDGYLLVTDMDNTLMNVHSAVSEENMRAIKYFTDNGGRFTIATGRSAIAARDKIKGLAINAPAILQNGAIIYDLNTDLVLHEWHIADERKPALKIMSEKYPFLGFEICSGDDVYIYAKCYKTDRFKNRKNSKVSEMTEGAWTLPWTKMIMIGTKETLDEYAPIYRQYDSGHAVRSGDEFFDIVPDDASKGKALGIIAEMLGIEKSHVIAAGDHFNDIDLLNAAGVSYAVENAADEVKAAADFAAPPCDKDAIAWIIGEIEKWVK
ncbi:MAG: HAD family hydrolase [Oscillospiraceae bacterium]|nr:HAD family hydrolase [Oscillospiraceae bacterium]